MLAKTPLHITADDYGLCSWVNQGIQTLAAEGHLTAVSLMVHGGAHLDGASALSNSGVLTGLHLVFVEEPPVSSPTMLAPLLDKDGCLPPSWRHLFAKLLLCPSLTACLVREAAAQLERFQGLGLELCFINSHQHVHLFPPLWRALQPLFRSLPAAAVRTGAAGLPGLSRQGSLNLSSRLSWALAPLTGNRPIHPLGVNWAGAMALNKLPLALAEARRLRPPTSSWPVELVVHPGLAPEGPDANAYAHWGYHWQQEMDLLRCPDFQDILGQSGFYQEKSGS